MAVQLPDLSGANCFFLTICGSVPAAGVQVPEVFRGGEKWHATEYEQSGIWHLIRAGWKPVAGGESAHLHFDITTRAYFDQRQSKPKTDVPPQEIERLVAAVVG